MRGMASLAVALAAVALVTFLVARTMDTTVTDSNQNLADGWATVLLVLAALVALPPILVATVSLDRSASPEDLQDLD